jgi:hypothetical protein
VVVLDQASAATKAEKNNMGTRMLFS